MIPKIIHYCWFGGKPMPENDAAYIERWKRTLPDYRFMLWNEENFDVNTVHFTRQVAVAKRWGFIVDYIRAWAVYNYGGIYLDTDVEVIKPLDDLLNNVSFAGFEDKKYINPGSIFAGEKGCAIAEEVMNFYANYSFTRKDGKPNLTPSPKIFTNILVRHGLKPNGTYQQLNGFTAYPQEYFCPKSMLTGLLRTTNNTYTIHHYDASWLPDLDKKYLDRRYQIFQKFGDNLLSKVIVKCLGVVRRLQKCMSICRF